jgi:hypothetical protein
MTLLSALDQMLSTSLHVGVPLSSLNLRSPYGSRESRVGGEATMGVNRIDLYHCHIVVPARLRAASSDSERERLQGAVHAEERQTLQQFQNSDITDANRAAFSHRLQAEERAATPLLERAVQTPEAGILLHSFEGNNEQFGIHPTSPRRNWFASFQTMSARPFQAESGEAGYSNQWSEFMSFGFLIDSNGMIHVRPFSSGSQALSDITGQSEGGVGGLRREIAGLEQPSNEEQQIRRGEAREEARRRAFAGPVERGRGTSLLGNTVYVDSPTDPSHWTIHPMRGTFEPSQSYRDPLRPPSFIMVGGRRLNLNPDGSVTPRMIRTDQADSPRGATPANHNRGAQ